MVSPVDYITSRKTTYSNREWFRDWGDRRETYYEAIGQVLVRIARSRLVAMGLEIDYINFAMKVRLENEKAFIAPQHN